MVPNAMLSSALSECLHLHPFLPARPSCSRHAALGLGTLAAFPTWSNSHVADTHHCLQATFTWQDIQHISKMPAGGRAKHASRTLHAHKQVLCFFRVSACATGVTPCVDNYRPYSMLLSQAGSACSCGRGSGAGGGRPLACHRQGL